MKITLKDGGREELKLLRLVEIGRFKNATDATEAAISLLYQKVIAEEMAAGAAAQAADVGPVDLFRLQGLSSEQRPKAVEDDDEEQKKPRASKSGKLSAQPR